MKAYIFEVKGFERLIRADSKLEAEHKFLEYIRENMRMRQLTSAQMEKMGIKP